MGSPATLLSCAHPLVSPSIRVIIYVRHGSTALPMLGVPKMYVGVSLTSPLQIATAVRMDFFSIGSCGDTQKEKFGGTLMLTLKKKHTKNDITTPLSP